MGNSGTSVEPKSQSANRLFGRRVVSLALGIALCGLSLAAWAEGPVNTVQDGRIVPGGTFYNTNGGKTTFTNRGGGGLVVQGGTTVRGLEVDAQGNLTNNGGTLHFYAPDSVVYIDGTVDVNGLFNGQGVRGNGGNVFVDAGYFFQNGNIFANGANGGLVQMNVGGMTLGVGARIEAKGMDGGLGGIVFVNSSGPVDLRQESVIDTSGRFGREGFNFIDIEGSVVNAEGIIRADGMASADGASRGGVVQLVAHGRSDLDNMKTAFASKGADGTSVLTGDEQVFLLQRNSFLNREFNGDVHIGPTFTSFGQNVNNGIISANGSSAAGLSANANSHAQTADSINRAGDGGSIFLLAERNVRNVGVVMADGGNAKAGPNGFKGGNGGIIVVAANEGIENDAAGSMHVMGGRGGSLASKNNGPVSGKKNGLNEAIDLVENFLPSGLKAGTGGDGGVIALSAPQVLNDGQIAANGGPGGYGGKIGHGNSNGNANGNGNGNGNDVGRTLGIGGDGGRGGLIVVSADGNPTGAGSLYANGGAGGSGLPLAGKGGEAGVIATPDPLSLPSHAAYRWDGSPGVVSELEKTPRPRLGQVRAVETQTAANEMITHNDVLVLLRRNAPTQNGLPDLSTYFAAQNATHRSVTDPLGTGAATTEINAKAADLTNGYRHFVVGSTATDLGLTLSRPESLETGTFYLRGLGSLSIANKGFVNFPAPPDFWNIGAYGGGRISILATGDINNNEDGYTTSGVLTGGGINLASRKGITTYDFVTLSHVGNGMHGGSIMMTANDDVFNISQLGGGSLIGASQRFKAGRDFINIRFVNAGATSTTPGVSATGGVIDVRAANQIVSRNDFDLPGLIVSGSGEGSHGGYVRLKANTIVIDPALNINATGTAGNGKVVLDGTVMPPEF